MSYSVSNNRTATTALKGEVSQKLEELPDGPGRDEAAKHQPVIDQALDALLAGVSTDEVSYSVSGSASPTSAYFSISINPPHD